MIVQTVSKVLTAVVIITVFYNETLAQDIQIPPIPCPNVFQYSFDGNKYVGIITLKGVSYGETTLNVEMAQPRTMNFNYLGVLSLDSNKDNVLDYIKSGTPITFKVTFPLQNVVPRVTDITVNNIRICFVSKDRLPTYTFTMQYTLKVDSNSELRSQHNFDRFQFLRPPFGQPTTENPFQQNYFFRNTISRLSDLSTPPPTTTTTVAPLIPITHEKYEYTNLLSICGRENNINIRRLVVHGRHIPKSRFPWIVAIYTVENNRKNFKCGGSLISKRTVVSAAHCFEEGSEYIRTENLLTSIGRHNLSEWQNSINIEVQGLIIHPDFRRQPNTLDADIAILQLKDSVRFTFRVRPICLWQGPTDDSAVDGTLGSIIGWGDDESHSGLSSVPKMVNATIVSELKCVRSNEHFYYLTSNRTICAGNRDGSGPCKGDSGSGLMIRIGNKWVLRAIVSSALATETRDCNLNDYVIFSDVAKFLAWIKLNMLL